MMLRFLEARFVELSAKHRAETDDLKRFQLDAQLKACYNCLEFFRKLTQRYYTLNILYQCFLVKLGLKKFVQPPPIPKEENVPASNGLKAVPSIPNDQESSSADVAPKAD